MHSMLIDPLASLLAQSVIGSIWGTLWPYLAMLGGFSAIVFVHELGHFAVAKWAGVRVEKFAIGFGRELIGFSWGETRYSFNLLPLGGYVKMLGQEDFDDKTNELKFNDDPRSFLNKSVGHRMAIVSAGVIMNIIFACFLFMIVFMIGMDAMAPRIAHIRPDSTAEKAGLLPGDIVREINGERILEFSEIIYAIMSSPPHEPLEFVVERDGVVQSPIWMKTESSMSPSASGGRRQVVGIGPGYTPEIVAVGPQIDTTQSNQPRPGDVLDEVAGIKVTKDNISTAYAMLAFNPTDIYVLRTDPEHPDLPQQRVRVQVPPLFSLYPSDLTNPESYGVLGLTPLIRLDGIAPGGRAYMGGLESGDTILSWDDKPFPSRTDILRAIRNNSERDIAYKVQKSNGRIVQDFVRPKTNRKGAGTIHATVKSLGVNSDQSGVPRTQFVEIDPNGAAAAAGIEPGDVVLSIHQNQFPNQWAFERVIQNNRDKALKIRLLKSDGKEVSTEIIPQASGLIGASIDMFAEDVLITGKIVAQINGQPSPAAKSGIPAGVRLLSVNGTSVTRWRDLIIAFRGHAGRTVDLTYLDHEGQTVNVPFEIPHSLRTRLGVGPEARIVRIAGNDTVTTTSENSTSQLSVQYHEGTRRKLTELVGQKDVIIEYRDNSMSELKTATVDITQDMVDPWLGRVTFSPSLSLAGETVLLKGENALDAISIGIHKTYYFILQVYTMLERLIFTRSVSVENISGPLGIIDIGGQIAQQGLVQFLYFLAMISANLAVINFLPFPIVDGGIMVFLIIEKIKGSPVSLRVQVATQMIGIFFLVSFFIFITYQDVLRMTG